MSTPTYIISGFLGSGKTTFIQSLLNKKPENEQWLIVINEFGNIELDKNELDDKDKDGLLNIPGGCVCCSSRLPLQVKLTQALRGKKFDKVFLEPTGLGHLTEIQELIRNDFKDVLKLEKTLSVVDLKNLRDKRYWSLPLFIDQITSSNLIVWNKTDTYEQEEYDNRDQFIKEKSITYIQSFETSFGKADLSILEKESGFTLKPFKKPIPSDHMYEPINLEADFMQEGQFIKSDDGSSLSFKLKDGISFQYNQFLLFATMQNAKRIKGRVTFDTGHQDLQYDGYYFDLNPSDDQSSYLEFIFLEHIDPDTFITEIGATIIKV